MCVQPTLSVFICFFLWIHYLSDCKVVQNILIVSCFVVEPSVCRQVQSADHLRFLLAPFAKITSLFTSALFPSCPFSRSEECLQSSTFHGVQSAASSSSKAGHSPEDSVSSQPCVLKLHHLPGVHQRPTASDYHFILLTWFHLQLNSCRHLLPGY